MPHITIYIIGTETSLARLHWHRYTNETELRISFGYVHQYGVGVVLFVINDNSSYTVVMYNWWRPLGRNVLFSNKIISCYYKLYLKLILLSLINNVNTIISYNYEHWFQTVRIVPCNRSNTTINNWVCSMMPTRLK